MERTSTVHGRLVGVDLARGFAILGMLWVHFAPDGTGLALPDGRSAILFATLAGVSLGLLTGGPDPLEGRGRVAGYRTVAIRGLVLVVLGRLLVLLGTPVAVILDYYGVLFLLLLVVLFAPRWVLAIVVLLALTGGAALVRLAGPDPAAAFTSRDPLEWPGQWLLTGLYPVALFAAYVAAGLIAARSDIGRRRTQLVMLASGAVLAPVGYLVGGAAGVDAGPHANTTWEAIGSGGVAIAVIGLLQLASGLRPVRVALGPIADMGSMALTVYTGQVLAAALFLLPQPAGSKSMIQHWWLLAVLVGASLAFAVIWRRLVGRGPLEQLLAVLSRAGGRGWRTGRASRPPRAILVGVLAGAVGAAAVSAAAIAVPPAAAPAGAVAAAPGGTVILNTGGSVRLRVDAALLRGRVRAAGVGRATTAADVVTLPITGGQVTGAARATGGGIVLDGSGISFTVGSDEVRATDLLLDLDAGTVAGDLTLNGDPLGGRTLLFFVAPVTPPSESTSSGIAVTGLRVRVAGSTATRIDHALGTDALTSGTPVGVADLAITDS